MSKHYLKEVNPSANQTEEAYKRICRNTKDASTDVARILFDMQNNNNEKSANIRLTIPSFTAVGNNPIERHIDVPRPKDDAYKPKELWDIFNKIKENYGKKLHKRVKRSILKELCSIEDDGKRLLSVTFRWAHDKIMLEYPNRDDLQDD